MRDRAAPTKQKPRSRRNVRPAPVARSGWRPAVHAVPAGTWSAQRVVAALQDWQQVTGDRPRIYEWSPGNARSLGLYGANCRRWEREHPRWPSAHTVAKYFGSWNEGLAAAGLSAARPRPALPLTERVAAARRLTAQGLRRAQIAELLDVSPATISAYLTAAACACGAPVIRPRSTVARCQRCAHDARAPRWDRATILDAYRAWEAQVEMRPFREDWSPESERSRRWHRDYPRWPSAGEVSVVFGRWGELVQAAGDPPAQRHWTRADVIAALAELADDLGRTPRSTDLVGTPGMPGRATVRAHLGSWSALLAELGLTAARRDRYTDPQLVQALRDAQRRHGRIPRLADLRASRPGTETIIRRFGTWNAALTAAGIDTPRPPSRRAVIAALRREAAAAAGMPPDSKRWRRPQAPTERDVIRLFGSWSAGIAAAGLAPRREHRARRTRGAQQPWTRSLVIARLQEWTDQVGRPPTAAEWSATTQSPANLLAAADKRQRQAGHWPSARTVARVCGSWAAAVDEAGVAALSADPSVSSLGERVRLAQRLRAQGLLIDDIAVHLGTSKWTVMRYQNAVACPDCGEPVVQPGDSGRCARCGTPARPAAFDRDGVLIAIGDWEREVGRPPAASEWAHQATPTKWTREHPRFPSYEQVRRLFGSWAAALHAAGTRAPNSRWNAEQISAALRRWADTHGRPPTQSEWGAPGREAGIPSASVVAYHFGSWSEGLRAAGLTAARRAWSDAQIIAALRAWQRRQGHAPTSTEWASTPTSDRHPSRGTVINRFGGWVPALAAAGLAPRRRADRQRVGLHDR